MPVPEPQPLAIGIDVGGTKIAAALVTRRGEVLTELREDTRPREGPGAVIERIADVATGILRAAPAPVAGLGLGIPGFVDPAAGIVTNAVNLGWDRVNLRGKLHDLLADKSGQEVDIWVENDANAMAIGDYQYGATRGCGDFVYISIGTGLGSGIMVDHRLVSGADFQAAELGHLSLDPDGRQCSCGMRGCVETVVSGPGMIATALELLAYGETSSLAEYQELTPEIIVFAAKQRDKVALATFEYTAQWLGHALSCCVVLLNPARIVIGGGLGLAAYDLLYDGIFREFRRRIIPLSYAHLDIVRSQVHASAIGASSLVWHASRNGHAC